MLVVSKATKKDIDPLSKQGFSFAAKKSEHELVRMNGFVSLILYKSGKLVVGGKSADLIKAKKMLATLGLNAKSTEENKPNEKKDIKKINNKIDGTIIGSDECLKGDTFGGIVVCAFIADDNVRRRLKELHVKDSKKCTNSEACTIAQTLINEFPGSYHCESIFPDEFNKMNSKMNITKILDLLHAKCHKRLAKKGATVIVDKYPGATVGDVIEERAESKYLEVAASSVIARYEGLKQVRELERRSGFFIPMGSTHVTDALLELKRKELNAKDYVKLSFSNVAKLFK
ncbi:MAG: hypothetical protein V1859_05640 [archaeon]